MTDLIFPHDNDEPVLELTDEQCWKLLDNTRHGRLAFNDEERIEIFPVNFVTDNGNLIFRTAPGTKLVAAAGSQPATFEADGILPDQGWSVVVRGATRVLGAEAEIKHAKTLGLSPWIPTYKDFFIEFSVDEVTGRHFVFGRQPEHDS